MIDTAMILAAGKGKRMRPLTDDLPIPVPKPMVEIAGRTLIDRVLDRLEESGIRNIVVNVHHMADMLEGHLRARMPEIHISDERDALLETGGGVKRALPLLGDGPAFVINSDALWVDDKDDESTLARMAAAWNSDRMDVLLLMVPTGQLHDYRGNGDFHMAEAKADDGRLTRQQGDTPAEYLYGGVQVLKPALLEGVAEDAFSLNRIYDIAAARGRLCGLRMKGEWLHVGTPEAAAFATEFIESREKS